MKTKPIYLDLETKNIIDFYKNISYSRNIPEALKKILNDSKEFIKAKELYQKYIKEYQKKEKILNQEVVKSE